MKTNNDVELVEPSKLKHATIESDQNFRTVLLNIYGTSVSETKFTCYVGSRENVMTYANMETSDVLVTSAFSSDYGSPVFHVWWGFFFVFCFWFFCLLSVFARAYAIKIFIRLGVSFFSEQN